MRFRKSTYLSHLPFSGSSITHSQDNCTRIRSVCIITKYGTDCVGRAPIAGSLPQLNQLIMIIPLASTVNRLLHSSWDGGNKTPSETVQSHTQTHHLSLKRAMHTRLYTRPIPQNPNEVAEVTVSFEISF